MNIFGLVVGQQILMLVLAFVLGLLGLFLMKLNWFAKLLGIGLFAGSVGWGIDILLPRNTNVPDTDVSLSLTACFLALAAGGILVYKMKDERGSLPRGGMGQVNKNAVIGGIVLLVCVFTTFSFLVQGNFESFFDFNTPAAERAANEAQNEVLRFFNTLLRSINKFLAK